jgi:hypothetical protein
VPIVAAPAPPADPQVRADQNGRYQLSFGPQDTYLLDTATGRVWQQTKISDVNFNYPFWTFMERIDSAEQFEVFVRPKAGVATKK